jgi:hypothetical protein
VLEREVEKDRAKNLAKDIKLHIQKTKQVPER